MILRAADYTSGTTGLARGSCTPPRSPAHEEFE
jgi:hypothetical protein